MGTLKLASFALASLSLSLVGCRTTSSGSQTLGAGGVVVLDPPPPPVAAFYDQVLSLSPGEQTIQLAHNEPSLEEMTVSLASGCKATIEGITAINDVLGGKQVWTKGKLGPDFEAWGGKGGGTIGGKTAFKLTIGGEYDECLLTLSRVTPAADGSDILHKADVATAADQKVAFAAPRTIRAITVEVYKQPGGHGPLERCAKLTSLKAVDADGKEIEMTRSEFRGKFYYPAADQPTELAGLVVSLENYLPAAEPACTVRVIGY